MNTINKNNNMNFSKKNHSRSFGIKKNNRMFLSKTKTLIMAFAIAILPLFTFAQATFDKFVDMDDVSVVTVNKKMFELMGEIAGESEEADDYISLIKGLNSLRILTTENKTIAAEMRSKVKGYLKSSNLSELMSVKDKEGNVKIYIKEGKDEDHVKELFMYIDGISNHLEDEDRKPEVVLVSITGDIDLNKISKLTKEMNIPGGKHLHKANKQ